MITRFPAAGLISLLGICGFGAARGLRQQQLECERLRSMGEFYPESAGGDYDAARLDWRIGVHAGATPHCANHWLPGCGVVSAPVSLSGTTAVGQSYTAQTTTDMRGGYSFTSVPKGTYTISATATSNSTTPGVAVSGLVAGVVVRGNIPTLMANLLLGQSAQMSTFSGNVTQDGPAVVGATVTIEVDAYPLNNPGVNPNSVTLTTTTNAQGNYQFSVPGIATDYYVDAHSLTSMVAVSDELVSPSLTTPNVQNFTLTDATAPIFGVPTLDIVTSTLPAATARGGKSGTHLTGRACARTPCLADTPRPPATALHEHPHAQHPRHPRNQRRGGE